MLIDDAEFALRAVREAPLISYDTETSGLDWKRNAPVGYVVTTEDRSVYIPIRHGGGGNLADSNAAPLTAAEGGGWNRHNFEDHLAEAFKERDRRGFKTVGHNLKFDMHFSKNGGIDLNRNVADTSIYQPLIDEFSYSFSLDASAKAHGVTPKVGDPLYRAMASRFGGVADKKQMQHFWRMPGNQAEVVDYAAGDGITTLQLYKKQLLKLAEEELERVARTEDLLIRVLYKMERRGIKIDLDRLAEVEFEIEARLREARTLLPPNFNPGSPKQVKELMEANGLIDWPLTEIGNPSFPEKWLKTNEPGRNVNKLRKFSGLINRYINPLKFDHAFEGRVHTNLHQLANDEFGTISGRLACSDPNLQALHKRDKELGRLFRSVYIADEGYDFNEGDYSQCEPRLFAHYSEDENLVKGYLATPFIDAHQVVADLLNVERDPTAKRMNMGIFTGMFPKTFAEHMSWDLDRATDAWNKWYEAFPRVREFQNAAKATMARRGYVKTLLGRRCRLDQPRFAYKGTSRIIQGGNADILKYKLVEASDFCEASGEDNIHMLMTVHDSFEWQSIKGAKGELLSKALVGILADVQKEPFNLIVPFLVDYKAGKNWAIATYGEEK